MTSVTMYFVIPQTITKSDIPGSAGTVNNFISQVIMTSFIVRFVRSVYYSDTLELIKYYLAIKASINAVRNIYKIRNLSI